MEFDVDLVKRVIRHIGCIAFKFEKSMENAVSALKEILEHNLEFTLSEGIIVARDIMRNIRARALNYSSKCKNQILKEHFGEFYLYMKNNTELITPYVENIATKTPSVKLEILGCVIKNAKAIDFRLTLRHLLNMFLNKLSLDNKSKY
jgi:hypothetical protein